MGEYVYRQQIILKVDVAMKEIGAQIFEYSSRTRIFFKASMDMSTARRHLCGCYTQGRFNYGSDEWPPYQPKHYTTLALIHRKGRHTDAEVIAVSQELANEGKVISGSSSNTQFSDRSQLYTKDISEIFAPGITSKNPRFILIEGAPGIGKTVLSKEIAYQWAINNLLKFKKFVFLLLLRDPKLKKICFIENLIQYMFRTTELVSNLSKFLFATEGKDLAIIFDGYDEMPEEDRNNSFVANIIKREVLPQCDLVVTSRPTASVHLRDIADCRVEVLGFTIENRLDYIEHALEGVDDKIKALQSYLQSNPTINALCYIPLNMTILLSLFVDFMEGKTANNRMEVVDSNQNLGSLPNTQTELYEKFILMTITRFLRKSKQLPGLPLWKLSNLPEPHNKIFEELCKLAFDALNLDKIVFELDDIEDVCPNLTMASDSWSGLGLLKAAQFVNSVSFHFLHFSIQEYLAAYYIASMSNNDQITLLKETFWNIRYFNTWIMYVGITGGENFAWRHFISVTKDTLVGQKPTSEQIALALQLEPNIAVWKFHYCHHVSAETHYCIATTLTSSIHTASVELDVSGCNLGVCEMENFRSCLEYCYMQGTSCLRSLKFSCNKITEEAADAVVATLSHTKLEKLKFKCNSLTAGTTIKIFKELENISTLTTLSFCCNMVTEQAADGIAAVLLLNAKLEKLDLSYNYLQTRGIIKILRGMKHISTLTKFNISCNAIRTDAADDIAVILSYNTKLKEIDLSYNFLQSRGVMKIAKGIRHISTIKKLKLSGNMITNEAVNDIVSIVSSNTEMEELDLSLNYLQSNGIMKVIKGMTNFREFNISCNMFAKHMENNTLRILPSTAKVELLKSDFLFAVKNYSRIKHDKYSSIYDQMIRYLTVVHPTDNVKVKNITNICKVMEYVSSLTKLSISNISITDQIGSDIAVALSTCSILEELNFTHNTFIATSAVQILKCVLKDANSLKKLSFCYNDFVKTTAKSVDAVYGSSYATHHHNTALVEFNLRYNNFPPSDIIEIMKELKDISTLKVFDVSNNCIPEEAGDYIASILFHNTTLEELHLSCTSLHSAGIIDVMKGLKNISTLRVFDISKNGISDEAADIIASALSHNNLLEELDLSCNSLQARSIRIIINGIKEVSTLKRFNVSNINVTDQVADIIASVLSHNFLLEELDLSNNKLQAIGTRVIMNGIKNISTLKKFNVSNNHITDEAADDIAQILSHNTDLKELDLSCNGLQAPGSIKIIKAMKNSSRLVQFNISHNNITEDAADYVAAVLSHNTKLEKLNLSLNNLQVNGAVNIFKQLNNISTLKALDISCNMITDRAADKIPVILSHNAELQELDLSYNFLQTCGTILIMKCLLKFSTLTIFNISCNQFTDEAADDIAAVVSCNTELEELDLSYNYLQSVGVIKIARGLENTFTLKKLKLSSNMITDEAASDITNVVSNNTQLEELDLSFNFLHSISTMQICRGMRNSLSLKIFNVSHNPITKSMADRIPIILPSSANLIMFDSQLLHSINRLQHISNTATTPTNSGTSFYNKAIHSIDRTMQIADFKNVFKAMEYISKLTKFCVMHVHVTGQIVNDILATLSLCSKLEELNLSDCAIQIANSVQIPKDLKGISTLKTLNISHNDITSEGTSIITNIVSCNFNLEELNLSCNSLPATGITKIMKGLKHVLNLKRFNVSTNQVTDETACDIASVLSHNTMLEELDLSYNNLQTAGVISIMKGMESISTLKKFNISHNNITDEAAIYVAVLLTHNTSLEDLDLSCTSLNSTSATTIMEGIKSISTLKSLYINNNNISDEAANYIAVVLSHSAALEEFDLSCNKLQTAGTATILKGMKTILTIKRLHIRDCNVKDKAAGDLAVVLSHNIKLEVLDVSQNALQTNGIITVLQAMEEMSNLAEIKISKNNISHQAADDIETVLSHNTKLQVLDLSYNIYINTPLILNTIMPYISGLVKLTLRSNAISDTNIKSVANFLSCNTKLEEIDLSYNCLKAVSIGEICKGLSNLLNLTKLDLSHNDISDEVTNSIVPVLLYNSNLKWLCLIDTKMCLKSISKISKALRHIPLELFDIRENDITDQEAAVIADLLNDITKVIYK
ncbi:protein NLRC5-like [Dysidea avara]|uniref:protein NLRC5-like n=1 Tax=Dysidea avara TaxID=196820 RepID=UPI003330EF7E